MLWGQLVQSLPHMVCRKYDTKYNADLISTFRILRPRGLVSGYQHSWEIFYLLKREKARSQITWHSAYTRWLQRFNILHIISLLRKNLLQSTASFLVQVLTFIFIAFFCRRSLRISLRSKKIPSFCSGYDQSRMKPRVPWLFYTIIRTLDSTTNIINFFYQWWVYLLQYVYLSNIHLPCTTDKNLSHSCVLSCKQNYLP